MAVNLTGEAQDGWDRMGEACPHLMTSPAADAWMVGAHLRRNGAPRPIKAATGRGHAVRVNGTHVFRLRYFDGAGVMVEAV